MLREEAYPRAKCKTQHLSNAWGESVIVRNDGVQLGARDTEERLKNIQTHSSPVRKHASDMANICRSESAKETEGLRESELEFFQKGWGGIVTPGVVLGRYSRGTAIIRYLGTRQY